MNTSGLGEKSDFDKLKKGAIEVVDATTMRLPGMPSPAVFFWVDNRTHKAELEQVRIAYQNLVNSIASKGGQEVEIGKFTWHSLLNLEETKQTDHLVILVCDFEALAGVTLKILFNLQIYAESLRSLYLNKGLVVVPIADPTINPKKMRSSMADYIFAAQFGELKEIKKWLDLFYRHQKKAVKGFKYAVLYHSGSGRFRPPKN